MVVSVGEIFAKHCGIHIRNHENGYNLQLFTLVPGNYTKKQLNRKKTKKKTTYMHKNVHCSVVYNF